MARSIEEVEVDLRRELSSQINLLEKAVIRAADYHGADRIENEMAKFRVTVDGLMDRTVRNTEPFTP